MTKELIQSRIIKTESIKCKICNSSFDAYKKENRQFCSKVCWKESKKGFESFNSKIKDLLNEIL